MLGKECLICRTEKGVEMLLTKQMDEAGEKVFVCPRCHQVYEAAILR